MNWKQWTRPWEPSGEPSSARTVLYSLLRRSVELTGIIALSFGTSQAETLRFATWNIENFWHVPGESLRGPYRGRDTVRETEDYGRIRELIDQVNADVWALQELGSPAAAEFLFPPTDWTLVFSPRYDPQNRRDIYTALAVAKDAAQVIAQDEIALNVTGGLRTGTAAQIEVGPRRLWVASIHLKAGCRWDPLESDRAGCATLANQVPHLEAWIDRHSEAGFLLGGDFNRQLLGHPFYAEGFDDVWLDLNDDPDAPLALFPFDMMVPCEAYDEEPSAPIDFIVTPGWIALASPPGPHVIDHPHRGTSDHCPVVLEISFP